MKKINFKLILKIFFSIGLIVFLFLNIDFEKISLIKLDVLLPFLFAIMITVTSISLMNYRWQLLIQQFLDRSIPYLQLWRYYLIGAFFNIFLPGAIGGDVVRTQRVSKRSDIKIKSASAVTLAERLVGTYGLLILLSFSLLFLNFPEELALTDFLPLWIFRVSPLVVLICIPVFKKLLSSFSILTSYPFLIKIIVISLLAQTGDVTIAYFFSQYFGLDIPFSAFLFVMPLVYFATVLPISLGGLGVREGAFSGLMVLYGVNTSIAIMISLLMYLVKVGTGILGYTIYLKEK